MRRTIVYSATRQWNPGDEFILFGTINIMNACLGKHNTLLYNRHPEIHPLAGEGQFRRFRLETSVAELNSILSLEKDLRLGFYDNSVKFDSRLDYVDYAVIAGSPECFNARVYNLYEHVLKNSLPLLLLGVGYLDPIINPKILDVLSQAHLITVRSLDLIDSFAKLGFNVHYLPCPALLAVPPGEEKKVEKVKKIGLVFALSAKDTVLSQYIDEQVYDYMLDLYRFLIQKNRDRYEFIAICHYIDELSFASRFFAEFSVPVHYAFDAKDYFDIYRTCDIVISPRVHGCGLASSFGIPSINISHDFRAATTEGFKSARISPKDSFCFVEEIIREIEASSLNEELISYKHMVFEKYCTLVSSALQKRSPVYSHVVLPIDESSRFVDSPAEIARLERPLQDHSAQNEFIDSVSSLGLLKILSYRICKNLYSFSLRRRK